MLYWFLKTVGLGPWLKAIWRPYVEGAENVPETGGAILASNHLSFCDSFFMPLMVKRRVTFLAKAEYFTTPGIKGWLSRVFFAGVGQVPIDRNDADAAKGALTAGVRILRKGELLGIYPEGTRSPDGRLYKGKTGVARLVLRAGVPVIPVGVINTQFVPSAIPKLPTMRRPVIKIGRPLDFSAYAAAGNDREVLRWVTDQIMAEVMALSGQEYVDAYGATVKAALAEGKPPPHSSATGPGAGSRVPPLPAARS